MNYERIKTIVKQKGITFKWLCGEINMSETGFAKMMREESMKVDTLEKIANKLSVNVCVFFEEGAAIQNEVSMSSELTNVYRQLSKTQQELLDCRKENESLATQKTVPVVSPVQKLKDK